MAVNFPKVDASQLHPVAGVTLGWAEASICKPKRKDLLVIALPDSATVSAVFTSNRFCAAPVIVSRTHLQRVRQAQADRTGKAGIRALVINAGNANAGMGQLGLTHAYETCTALARVANILPEQVLPFSTGVILEPLPIERMVKALPLAWAHCAAISTSTSADWYEAAEAIMTTDTQVKAASRRVIIAGHPVTFTGISKGAGMIKPNMATMLGFIATDAAICQEVLDALVQTVADQSFNRITVDGETSTNDSLAVIASGQSSLPLIKSVTEPAYFALRAALIELAQTLAQMIVRDGEGATKFITIQIDGGTNIEECRQIGYAISHSQLVKTAFFASDPNLGRILCAIGHAGVRDLDTNKIQLYLDDIAVVKSGGRDPNYCEADAQRVMQQSEITVRVILGRGTACATIWTCDLSDEYVRINADYRS